jgi:uncharacterized integral membrane protein (TIGR00697 family)
MQTLTERDYKKILICLTLYITSLFAANTLGIKLMPFFFGTHLSVGVFCFPVVFIMTDIIGEVYGKKMAKNFVLAGVISILLFMFYSFISSITPWADKALWAKDSWNTIFGLSFRFSIASVIAFIVGEYQDVFTFFFLRSKTEGKYFWLRSNLSNLWSQLVDTVLFMSIAFVGTGYYGTKDLIIMIVIWWMYKVLMGILYTPFSYLGIYLLTKDANKNNQN